jgi:serine/threonine-protein kinase
VTQDPSDFSALLGAIAAAPTLEPLLVVGTLVGRYRIDETIGRGGMGIVYRAHDTLLGRPVALKAMLVDDPSRRARFLREARAAAALNHPNVVTVYDVVEHESRLCVVMELLEGRALRSYVGETVPMETRLGWLRDIAAALEVAHRAGLVHRDIKPENVVVTREGIAKVLDFGLVLGAPRADGATTATHLTQEGVAIGTPGYMAPEQIAGATVDSGADQFAWGVVAYELLSGARPWVVAEGASAAAVLAATLTQAPKPLDSPDIPTSTSRAVARALAKERANRFSSMSDVRAALAGASASAGELPASGEPGIDSPLRIDHAPLPTSDVPGAVEEYAGAIRSFRDGDWNGAFEALVRATKLDPNLAPALVRLAFVGRTNFHLLPEEARALYRRALTLRDRLEARDAAILRALEPLVLEDPPDTAEIHRRFARLTELRPLDAELLALAGYMHSIDGADPERTRDWAERSIAIDPHYGDAWHNLADVVDDDEAARAALLRSVEIGSGCTDGWYHLAVLAAQMGDAKGTEQYARRSVTGGVGVSNDLIAGALYARGADARSVSAARARVAPSVAERRRPSVLALAEVPVAVLEGDFERAAEHLSRWADVLGAEDHNEIHSVWVALRALLARERGDRDACARIARDFLVDRETRTMPNRAGRDETALCLAMCAAAADDAGRRKIARERRAWLESSADGRTPVGWGLAYGFLLEDARDDAHLEEARAALPVREPVLFRRLPMLRFDHGLALRHLGETARARECMERAARTLMAPQQPFRSTLAHLHLGELREADGDREGAAAAYQVVLDRWGKAQSVSADRARRGLDRLRASSSC